MARFKPAGTRKAKAADSKRGLIPCAILLLAGFALIGYMMYAVLTSGK
jgi:hypothetical protein